MFPPRTAVSLCRYTRQAGQDALAVDEYGPPGGPALVRPHVGDPASSRDACGECMPSPHKSSHPLPLGTNQIARTDIQKDRKAIDIGTTRLACSHARLGRSLNARRCRVLHRTISHCWPMLSLPQMPVFAAARPFLCLIPAEIYISAGLKCGAEGAYYETRDRVGCEAISGLHPMQCVPRLRANGV